MDNDDYLIGVVKKNAEKISKASVFVSVVSANYLESPYCAMQLGLAILLNKPIRLLVKEGIVLPENLVKVAEKVEYFMAADDIGLASDRLLEDLR